MEGVPGFLCGPPEAKRPRLGEDALCGSMSGGHSPKGDPVSLEHPQGPKHPVPAFPWCTLSLLAPLLEGLPLGEPIVLQDQKGAVGGSTPKRRRAPNDDGDDEGSPSPKTPRRAREVRPAVGTSSGHNLPLSIWGTWGAPRDPGVIHMTKRNESLPSTKPKTGLSSLGQLRATAAWNSRRGASPQSVLEMAEAFLPSSRRFRALMLSSPEVAEGVPKLQPAVLGVQNASPPRSSLFFGARIFHFLDIALGSQKDKSRSAWFGGCELLRSKRRLVVQNLMTSLYSQNNEVQARPWEPQHIKSVANLTLTHLFSGSDFLAEIENEFILEKENNLKWIRQFHLNFHINNTLEKHDTALLLIVAFVSIWRDASLRQRRTLALLPKDNNLAQCWMESVKMDTYFLNGILVSTQQKIFLTGSSGTNCFLPIKSRFLETANLFTIFEKNSLIGLSFAFLPCLNEIPKWKSRKLKNEKNSNFLKKENGIKSVAPKKRRRHTVHLLLTTFKTSNFAVSLKYECNKVRECINHKEGNYVSEVTGTCLFITTEIMDNDFKQYHNNSLHFILKDTVFPVFDAYDKVPLLSDLVDSGSISLSKKYYNISKNSEKAINLEALDALAIRHIPQFIQYNQINTTEHFHKTNTIAQSIVIKKKQIFNFNSFNFKGKFNCFLDIEQQVKLVNYGTIFIGPDTMIKTQEEFVENSLNEGKGKMQDLIWNERKHPTENVTGLHNYQISNANKTEREQKCSIIINDTMTYILNPNLVMKKKPNIEDTREINQIPDNQNTTDRNEHILQESALANSKLFHPNNESTEFVNHKIKTDLATRNNEHSPDLPTECLSTETRIISDFKMKREFDIVLKELCMFHEIGKEEETLCIAETKSNEKKNDSDKDNSMEIKEDLIVVSENICASSLPCDTIKSVSDMPKTIQSSFKWKKIHMDPVKEEPHEYCSSSPSDDELLSPSGRDFEKASSQSPALFSDTFVEGRIHSLSKEGSSLSHGIVRVYPLKTCCGPIRIGLSRKAKPKQLHPYLK